MTAMRVRFSIDGGIAAFPGLRKPVTIDCAGLLPAQVEHIRELMHRADFFVRKDEVPASAAPDARAYTIDIDDGERRRTLKVAEPIADAPLRDLVAALRGHADIDRGIG